MKPSTEYALKRLNQWYTNSLRRNYTRETADEFKRRVMNKLEGTETYDKVKTINAERDMFAPEILISTMNPYFSEFYPTLENLARDRSKNF